VSYLQAGFVCRLIAEEWGFEKIVELIHGYAENKSTPENFQQTLGVSAGEFDERFAAYLDDRYGEVVEDFEGWRELLEEALKAARDKRWEDVFEPAREALNLFPEYIEAGSPYGLLAEAYQTIGDETSAIQQLLAYRDQGGYNPGSLNKLADLLIEQDRRREAIETLTELVYVKPGGAELHQKLGGWLFEERRFEEAAREFQAVLALNPLDKAGAHYDLARTYHRMDKPRKARRFLLLALESAPGYRPAQKLLLEIVAQREKSE